MLNEVRESQVSGGSGIREESLITVHYSLFTAHYSLITVNYSLMKILHNFCDGKLSCFAVAKERKILQG